MSLEHARHHDTPLEQNTELRGIYNTLPVAPSFDMETFMQPGGGLDDLYGRIRRGQQTIQEGETTYHRHTRDRLAAHLADSYATQSLRQYALHLFDKVFEHGRQRDATKSTVEQRPPSFPAEISLLALTANDDLQSAGIFDPLAAPAIEQRLYTATRWELDNLARDRDLDQRNGSANSVRALEAQMSVLQAIITNWQQEIPDLQPPDNSIL